MRAFSTLFIAAAFALSANAATVNKRSISATVQTCIDSMVSTGNQLDVVTTAVASFTSAGGLAGANAIHTLEQELETRLKKAGVDCCVEAPAVTLEEADAVLATVGVLVPKIEGALTQIQNKKPQFDAILFATGIVKTDIKNLATQTKTLDTCLVAKTPLDPPSYLDQAHAFVAQIDAAFTAAKNTYGIV